MDCLSDALMSALHAIIRSAGEYRDPDIVSGQPPGWGHTSDVCQQASASLCLVSGPSLGECPVRKLEAACVSPTLASREWGYPLVSGLPHITFPLI